MMRGNQQKVDPGRKQFLVGLISKTVFILTVLNLSYDE